MNAEPLIITPEQAEAQLAAANLDPKTLNVTMNIIRQRVDELLKAQEAARFAGTNANRHRIQGGLGALSRILQDLSAAMDLCRDARTIQSSAQLITPGGGA